MVTVVVDCVLQSSRLTTNGSPLATTTISSMVLAPLPVAFLLDQAFGSKTYGCAIFLSLSVRSCSPKPSSATFVRSLQRTSCLPFECTDSASFLLLLIATETGVNLVKISSLNSMTEAAAKASVGHDGVVNGYGKDHTDFFDQCEKNNIAIFAPIYPNDAQSLMSETTASWQKKVQNLLDEIGNHKALYAFYIGSDWGLNEPSQSNLLQRVNEVMDYVHSHSNAKITTCVSSIPTSAPSLIPTLHWDFVCANAGWDAGSGLSSFLGDANSSTSNSWSALAKQHGLPIILGEAGVANSNSSFISDHPHFFNDLLQSTLSFYSKGIVGQVFVSYSDDPTNGAAWKRYLGFMTPVVQSDGLDNSTQPDIFWADGLNQKAGLYDSVVSGTTSDGSTLNYNTNVFTFMGRDPQAVTPSAKATPNSSTPTSARSPSLLSLAIVLVCSLIAIIRY